MTDIVSESGLTILPGTPADLPWMLEQLIREEWNPNPNDLIAYSRVDPQGYLIGWLGGERVGCVATLVYDSTFAFVGLYIVIPPLRGRGYGKQLFQAALRRARASSTHVYIEGMSDLQGMYGKMGFTTQYITHRLRLVSPGPAGPSSTDGGSDVIAELSSSDLADVIAYDSTCFPPRREGFLTAWLSSCHAVVAREPVSGAVRGYGAIRKAVEGYRVGPLYADNTILAQRLLQALVCGYVPTGTGVSLDVPDYNLPGFLEPFGEVSTVFKTARMVSSAPSATSGAPTGDGSGPAGSGSGALPPPPSPKMFGWNNDI